MNPLSLLPWLIVLIASIAALAVVSQAVLPDLVDRARVNLERRPVRSTVVGLVNVAFFGVVSLAFLGLPRPGIRLVGAIIGTLLLGLVALGLTAVAGFVGERLRPDDANPVRRLVIGSVTLSVAALVPFVGWYLLATLASLIGVGATILAVIWRDRPSPPRTDRDARPPVGSPAQSSDTSIC